MEGLEASSRLGDEHESLDNATAVEAATGLDRFVDVAGSETGSDDADGSRQIVEAKQRGRETFWSEIAPTVAGRWLDPKAVISAVGVVGLPSNAKDANRSIIRS